MVGWITVVRVMAAFAAFVVCSGAIAEEPVTLRYGAGFSTIRSIYSLPIVVARDQGFFAREGIAIDVIVPPAAGSEGMIKALHDGIVDVTHVATPFLVSAVLGGSDAVAIAAEFHNPIYSLVAKPNIRSFADLRGKQVGLADEAGTISISIRRLMAMHGLKPGDVRVKVVTGTPARLRCLQHGDCDAVPLGQPQDLVAAAEGYRVLGLSTEAAPDLLYTVTAVRRSWAAKHRDLLVRYVRALAAAFRFIRDPANRDAAVRTIVGSTKVAPEIARRTLALYLEPDRGVLPKRGELRGQGLANVIAMMGEAGLIAPPLPSPERFIDRTYLRAAWIE
jgi:ABC-type nitrate/sulfonate/bicarbonate transport system substrate-binding protein